MPSHTENSKHSNILLELNSGFDSVLLYVCTIKAHLHEFTLSSSLDLDSISIDNHLLYSMLTVNWSDNNFTLFQNNTPCQLLKYVYAPIQKRCILNKLRKGTCIARLLIGNSISQEFSKNNIVIS